MCRPDKGIPFLVAGGVAAALLLVLFIHISAGYAVVDGWLLLIDATRW